jgi:hypothetical protein
MIIYYGTRLFGKTDIVPGNCHVATCFLHIYRVPLIPLGSWIVTTQKGSKWQGIKTSLSIKSVLMAWLRAAMILATLTASILVLPELSRVAVRPELLAPYAVVALVGLAGFFASYRLSTASPKRACELLLKLGVDAAVAEEVAYTAQSPAVGETTC